MKIGLVARADNTGLGNQTWEFYKHMNPYRTMVVDIGHLNGNKQHYERYPDIHTTMFIKGFPTDQEIDEFLNELDVVFIAEAAYNNHLYIRARQLGVKTAVQYNYEFFDWIPNATMPLPDMFIAPSKWHYHDVDMFCRAMNIKHVYLHCPVNRETLPFRHIPSAQTFLHMAGKPAAHDRNGTETVIKAAKYVKTPAKILIHFQGNQGLKHQATNTVEDYMQMIESDNVEISVQEFEDYADCYKQGDVLLLPRRYGGNCLPLNEALSTGMPAIMPDISPNNELLPANWLVPARQIAEFQPRTTVEIYDVNPVDLAAKIDEFHQYGQEWFVSQTAAANTIASQISWEALKPQYDKAFAELCSK